ncbi:hypothetical protein CH63R_09187 [Colletotrichum higginsianum IMI 349063]|uniref:Uncharacterized protein n=1 Tax=Colletotrichum higginsianum (strain IMI 349063) TaxID=759273 RepID=A0A1B7Y6N5_COLHI|nr:hypothetical protein CH63R_09187 [Colletotrichum higginsianum IMI 349063]OBR07666.1 hypothetical protein CH63R_09187 [Colletotrichum higginsianum IMI 349063]
MFPYAFARRTATPPNSAMGRRQTQKEMPNDSQRSAEIGIGVGDKKHVRNLEMTRTPAKRASSGAGSRLSDFGVPAAYEYIVQYIQRKPRVSQFRLRSSFGISSEDRSCPLPGQAPLAPPSEIHLIHTKEGGELSAGTDIFASSKQTRRLGVKVSIL